MIFGKNLDIILQSAEQMNFALETSKHGEPLTISQEVPSINPVVTASLMEQMESDRTHKLDASTKDHLEYVFGIDLSQVVIHTGAFADELTRKRGAHAVTIGRDIYFAQGMYAPDTEDGARLLAHELVHVTQNARGDRHLYKEEVAAAEVEAAAQEAVLNTTLLFENVSTKEDSTDHHAVSGLGTPVPHIGQKDGHKETPLDKAFMSDPIRGKGNQAVEELVYEILLNSGEKIDLTKGELRSLFTKFQHSIQNWMEEQKYLTNEEYEEKMLKAMDLIGR